MDGGAPGVWLVRWRAPSLRQGVQQRPQACAGPAGSLARWGLWRSGPRLVGSCLRVSEAPGVCSQCPTQGVTSPEGQISGWSSGQAASAVRTSRVGGDLLVCCCRKFLWASGAAGMGVDRAPCWRRPSEPSEGASPLAGPSFPPGSFLPFRRRGGHRGRGRERFEMLAGDGRGWLSRDTVGRGPTEAGDRKLTRDLTSPAVLSHDLLFPVE